MSVNNLLLIVLVSFLVSYLLYFFRERKLKEFSRYFIFILFLLRFSSFFIILFILINPYFNKKKKIIACICSGAQLLISAKIVLGRKIAGYYSMKDDIINAGAKYTDRPAVVDQNLITTAHYKDMGPWMAETIRLLNK